MISQFREASRRLFEDERECPKCHARDLQPPAWPTLELEQDGSFTCTVCGTNFHWKDRYGHAFRAADRRRDQ